MTQMGEALISLPERCNHNLLGEFAKSINSDMDSCHLSAFIWAEEVKNC